MEEAIGFIGFWLIGCALVFMMGFLMADSLDTKEEIKTSLKATAVITVIMFSMYLLTK